MTKENTEQPICFVEPVWIFTSVVTFWTGIAVAGGVAYYLTPGGGVVDLLVDAALMTVILAMSVPLAVVLGIVGVLRQITDSVEEAVETLTSRTHGNPPPVVAPLKKAEQTWPEHRPSRVNRQRRPHPPFRGHQYGLGERDAL